MIGAVSDPRLEREYVEHLPTTDVATPFGLMRFKLTYLGSLPPVGGRGGARNQVEAKWEIRKQLHPQLEDLYRLHPAINQKSTEVIWEKGKVARQSNLYEVVRKPTVIGAHSFVPLVRKSLSLGCQLDITYLRPGSPGSLITENGDLDNRMNTLFDALRVPHITEIDRSGSIQTPFHCLLEDDALVTGLAVHTDRLLSPPPDIEQYAHLVIDVTVRVLEVTPANRGLLGD